MKIYENENVLGYYLLKYGSESELLIVQYRESNSKRQLKKISFDEWTEITESKK